MKLRKILYLISRNAKTGKHAAALQIIRIRCAVSDVIDTSFRKILSIKYMIAEAMRNTTDVFR